MEIDEIKQVFKEHWKKGWSSINPEEAQFIQSLIAEHRPERFIEIGMASGLSGGLICRFLDENGGKRFVTVDRDNTFFGDPRLPNGFALDSIYTGKNVTVDKRPYHTALSLKEWGEDFDMAFVDANHQHPWPLIDTLCLYPHLKGPKIVVHHDLRLYRSQEVVYGMGPKILFDQFPPKHRFVSPANRRNTFYVDLKMKKAQLGRIAEAAFYMPWSIRTPINAEQAEQLRDRLGPLYGPAVLEAFDAGLRRFNTLAPGRNDAEPAAAKELADQKERRTLGLGKLLGKK